MRSRRWIDTCLSSIATVGALAASGGNVGAQTPDAIDEGRRLFIDNGCYACHGTVGQGGERSGGPRLAPDPLPFEALKAIVRHPPEAMPRFDPKYLSDAQLQSIHRYLASIAKGPGAKELPLLQVP